MLWKCYAGSDLIAEKNIPLVYWVNFNQLQYKNQAIRYKTNIKELLIRGIPPGLAQ